MRIIRIKLENFVSYYGVKEFTFTRGMNVVNGANATGKSKLFDAVYWVLNDQIWEESREVYLPTLQSVDSFVSKKAIRLAQGNSVNVSVELELEDENQTRYRLLRTFIYKGKDQTGSKLVIKETPHLRNTIIHTDVADQNRIISGLIPTGLRKYMWFRSEQLREAANFNKPQSLIEALNALSNIDHFTNIDNYLQTLLQNVNNQYDTAKAALMHNTTARDALLLQRKENEEEQNRLEVDIARYSESIRTNESRIQEIFSQTETAVDIRVLESEINALLDEKENLEKQLTQKESQIIDEVFSKKWLLSGSRTLFEKFEKRISVLDEAYISQRQNNNVVYRLPEGTPDPYAIRKMLEEEKCFLCNRDVKKNTEAWEYISGHLSQQKDSTNKDGEIKKDFYDDFKNLYRTCLSKQSEIMGVAKSKETIFGEIKKITENIDRLEVAVKQKQTQMSNLLDHFPPGLRGARNISAEHAQLNEQLRGHKLILERKKEEYKKVNSSLEGINKKLDKLVVGKIDPCLENKKKVIIDLKNIANSTRKRVFEQILNKIETEANRHLSELVSHFSPRVLPRIVLEPVANGYLPTLYNEDGTLFVNPNSSLLNAKDLALILAIVTSRMNPDKAGFYPIVTDAPTSKASGELVKGFIECLSRTFDQSIIIFKDMLDQPPLKTWYDSNRNIEKGENYIISLSGDEIIDDTITNQEYLETMIQKI